MYKVQLQISLQCASFLGIEIIETSPVILYSGLLPCERLFLNVIFTLSVP